jgi:septum formation protein
MLVLASASPRRQELLRNAGIAFTVQPANIPEIPLDGENAQAFAERVAKEKALAICRALPEAFVLAADTVVVVDSQILGKPRDEDDAFRMLCMLSGRRHEVITGVSLSKNAANGPGVLDVRSETTTVVMDQVSDDDIRAYVQTGEPMDKAGAYAIQGGASRWISRIEGDYFNVMGLPVSLVHRMLREHHAI